MKMYFFYFYFLILHILTDNVLYGMNFLTHLSNIRVEGIVSQIFVSGLSFCFMKKTGNFLPN